MLETKVLKEDLENLALDIANLGYKNNTIFVTGATGLLGSILVKAIVKANEIYDLNNKVVALARNEEKAKNIFIDDFLKIEWVISDVTQPINYNGNIDYVIHGASITTSKMMVEQPVEVIDTTINGTFNILNFAKQKQAKKVVFLSTMEVFGKHNDGHVLKEDDLGYLDITSVRSSYPESKRMAENICVCFAKEFDIDISIARLTQTFGAGADVEDKRIFGIIANRVAKQQDIVLASKGDLVRDYCYSIDALNAIMYIMKYGKTGNVYSVANPKTNTSVYDMANLVAKCYGRGKSKVRIEIPEDVEKMGFSPASITRLDTAKLESLGWKPRYNLEEMYGRLIEDFKEKLEEKTKEDERKI